MTSSVTTMPKTATFQFRINPKVREQAEAVYAGCGLTLTDAINIFIQQSLNAGGFPFPVTADNAEYVRAEAMKRLMAELDAGKNSGELVDEEDVYRMLEAEDLL